MSAVEVEGEAVVTRALPLLADPCLGRGMGGVDGAGRLGAVEGVDSCGTGSDSARSSTFSVWLRGRGTGGLLASRRVTPE